jgi:hypothetical protein
MARHLICIIHGVGKHDSNKRRERLDEMVKNKDLLLPRVGGDVDFEFRFTEWHRCHTRVMSLYFATSPSSVSLLSLGVPFGRMLGIPPRDFAGPGLAPS